MVTRTFLSKCTTIYEGSRENFGLNPVIMINRGLTNSRALVQFNINKITENNTPSTKHILKMYNCGSLDEKTMTKKILSEDSNGEKLRAVSFDLMAFRVPYEWDRGRGFDNSDDKWFAGDAAVSTQGCNWYQAADGHYWQYEGIYSEKSVEITSQDSGEGPLPAFDNIISGIGTNNSAEVAKEPIIYLDREYERFLNGEDSVVVAVQHFATGTEDMQLDLTKYVNDVISGKYSNNGLCICFAPVYDDLEDNLTRYVGFFTDKTNTFYEPVLESRNSDVIIDSRQNFRLGIENKLYFYANALGDGVDFDEMPVCKVDGIEFPVTHYSEGVYYATVKLSQKDYEPDMILVDEWSNLKYNDIEIEAVEQEFVTHAGFSFTNNISSKRQKGNEFVVLSGVRNDEKVNQGDERIIEVTVKIPYSGVQVHPENKMSYRLYVKDAYREVDVIDWDGVNILPDTNYFTLDTSTLLPQEYHVDIKVGNKTHKDKLYFKVVNNITGQHV